MKYVFEMKNFWWMCLYINCVIVSCSCWCLAVRIGGIVALVTVSLRRGVGGGEREEEEGREGPEDIVTRMLVRHSRNRDKQRWESTVN